MSFPIAESYDGFRVDDDAKTTPPLLLRSLVWAEEAVPVGSNGLFCPWSKLKRGGLGGAEEEPWPRSLLTNDLFLETLTCAAC